VRCALEPALTEKVSFLVKYIPEFLENENLQGPNNFRLIEPYSPAAAYVKFPQLVEPSFFVRHRGGRLKNFQFLH
jgi:hypothetical protein